MADNEPMLKVEQSASVDLGGDVNLVVGSQEHQTRIRVCKPLLSLASPYFKALFNQDFKEHSIAAEGGDVVLMDDEPDAVVNLCKILHMQYTWPRPMSATELLHLAIVADKYGYVKAIQLAVESPFPTGIKNWKLDSVATCDLVVASYPLDHASRFTEYTHAVLVSNSDALNGIALSEIGQRIPLAAWFELETRRSDIVRDILSTITSLFNRGCGGDTCQRMADWCLKMTKAVNASGLVNVAAKTSISQLLTKADNIKIPHIDLKIPQCACLIFSNSSQSHHPYPVSKKHFEAALKACRDKCKGLFLDCVRADGKSEDKYRIPHG